MRTMGYFAGRVGAESVRKLQIGSPFNYREQMRLIVARSMPEPDQPEYAEVLPEWIKRYLAESAAGPSCCSPATG